MPVNWWMESLWRQDPALLISWVFWVFLSITLHELGHGWAAVRRGDDTPIHLGRLTWNPLVHMGGMSLIVFLLTGIAWGSMPVNSSRLKGRHAEAYVAFCGPFMNLSLALASVVLGRLWLGFDADDLPDIVSNKLTFHGNMGTFFIAGTALNVALFMFNLLPAPPLDGSRIVADFVPSYGRLLSTQTGAAMSMVMLVVAFLFIGKIVFGVAFGITMWAFAVGR